MIDLRKTGALAGLVAGLAFAPAAAAAVIDQRQEGFSAFAGYAFGTPTQSWSFTQTFRPAANDLAGAAIRFNLNGGEVAGPGPEDWFSLSVTGGGQTVPLAAQTFAIDADGWVTSFWTPVPVVAGDTYRINFAVFGGSQAPPYSLYVNTADGYAAGRLTDRFFFIDGNDDPQSATDVYSGNGNFDAVFRTFSTAGAVPEPASWALFVTGFALVGAALRRRGARMAVTA